MFHPINLGSTPCFQFEKLAEIEGFRHVLTGKTPSQSETGLSDSQSAPPKDVLGAIGINPNSVVQMRQVHGDRVLDVNQANREKVKGSQADGLVIAESGSFGAIRSADCVPVLAVVPSKQMVGVAHAGWRGTLKRVAQKTVVRLLEHSGASPGQVLVALGPSIGLCCYQVGPEVLDQFSKDGQPLDQIAKQEHLDLTRAIRFQLSELGVNRVLESGQCTACQPDLFYSYRRNQTAQRMWLVAGFC